MLIDSHCHLNLLQREPSVPPLEQILLDAKQAGVEHILCPGVELTDMPEMLKIVADFGHTYPLSLGVGLHPNEAPGTVVDEALLLRYAMLDEVVAIGETGLDYYRLAAAKQQVADYDWQRERLRRHIAVAKQVGKPLIIHARDAQDDLLTILQAEDAAAVGGVLHCFTGDLALATEAMALNFYISFSGIITFNNAKALQTVAQNLPLSHMLIETDAPFLAPVPYRGKTNVPTYVQYVAAKIAELHNTTVAAVATATTNNFYKLFQK